MTTIKERVKIVTQEFQDIKNITPKWHKILTSRQ